MSIFNTLFGNNTTTSSQATQLTGPAINATNNLFNRADAYANQPWTGLTPEQRVAGFTPDQQAAFESSRDIRGDSASLYDMLRNRITGDMGPNGALAGLMTPFNKADIASYMNPYTEAVLDPAIADIERRSATSRNALIANSAKTGSFGGSRNAIAQQELERNTLGEIGRTSANERARAFNEAAQQYRNDQQILPGLQQRDYANLGMLFSQNAARLPTEVNSLLATGGLQQGLNQANLDVNASNFLESRDWGQRGINALLSALGTGGTLGASTTRTEQGPEANRLGQIVGATTGLLGSLGSAGASALSGLGSGAWNAVSDWFGGGGGNLNSGNFNWDDSSLGLGSIGGGLGGDTDWSFS